MYQPTSGSPADDLPRTPFHNLLAGFEARQHFVRGDVGGSKLHLNARLSASNTSISSGLHTTQQDST
jgi:hypothetical protein